ncbi:MAG: AAA family ATPase, partial [Acidimicrobiales bacterium]|nr:AAA family ATPase [Acidimicrobiales bacterium]
MTCSGCGAQAADDARFCASCGRPLRQAEDERRVVTVVFGDLVGFTSMSERTDPERVKNLVDGCFDRLAEDVVAFGGQVDKIVGDAIVALFGATVAHEDDPERAVRAALRMQATLREEAEAVAQGLQMRIGVNTGEVLVGAMRAAGSVTAMGDVVNTASRLQTAAAPGEVLVGPATHAATHHTIAYEARGRLDAKGRDEPVETWSAVMPTLPPGYRVRRVDVPLIGRDRELALLRSAIESSVRHRRPMLALVVGDVGLGKSRLADETTAELVRTHEAVVREGRCVPYGEANVWWPVADALRGGLRVDDGATRSDAGAAVRSQVAAALGDGASDAEVGRTADGLLTLLGYEGAAAVDPLVVRQEAGRALAVYASAVARTRPLVLKISDLHWADPAVLELIDDVFAAIGHLPVVMVATARPSLLDQWTPRPGRHNALTLHLDPLEHDAAVELLHHLVGSPVDRSVADALYERSGGNPFFLEELVSLLDGEAAAEPGRVAALPDTLRGLVSARLDDLSPGVRGVLQDASVIGQTGPMMGLREMARKLDRGDADEAMAALVADEIMELDGEQWRFRSDLVREVAYQTVTKSERALSHLGIARYLERKSAELDPRPPWVVEQLAHHYATAAALAAELGPGRRTDDLPADLADTARTWVVDAADRARRDQALPAAVRLYTQALDLLGDDVFDGNAVLEGDVADRRCEAIRLHLARGRAASEGWDVAMAGADAAVARREAERVGDEAAVADALVVQGTVLQKEGDLAGAIAALGEAADRSRDLGDVAGLGEALRQRALVEIFAGDMVAAEASATAAQDAFAEVDDAGGQAWAAQNLAWVAFTTGRPDEADRHLARAQELFGRTSDAQGLAWTLGLLAFVRFQQGRVVEARTLGEQVLEEAQARSDPWSTAMMRLLVSMTRLWRGRTDDAVDLAERALRTFDRLGDRYGMGQGGAVLGRSLVMAGRVDEGFALLRRAGEHHERDDVRGPAGGQIARLTTLVAALQIGDPDRAAAEAAELEALVEEGDWGDDPAVVLALHALQRGDAATAVARLEGADPDHLDPNV